MSRSWLASWKPGPERIQCLHDFEAAQRRRRQLFPLGQRQIAVGAHLAAADPAAQLIELGQPEHVGAVHDQRVGRRDVEPGFDDVGRQEEVVGALVEGGHHGFELGRGHPAMRRRDADLGHHLAQFLAHLVEIGDARRDIEDLPAAVALAQDRLAHHDGIERHHKRAHREPVDRRGGDDAHLAHPGKRQLQGARDRRRGQRQHVHVGLQLLQPLLLRDPEMLLLVDDDEPQMGKTHILGEERVGADDDFYFPVGEVGLDLLCVFGWDQP